MKPSENFEFCAYRTRIAEIDHDWVSDVNNETLRFVVEYIGEYDNLLKLRLDDPLGRAIRSAAADRIIIPPDSPAHVAGAHFDDERWKKEGHRP